MSQTNGTTSAAPNEAVLRLEAAKRASHEPFPGPLTDAFAGDVIMVGDIVVRPIVAYDTIIFKKIDSPLYRQMLESNKPVEQRDTTDFTDEEGFEMCYQFTRTCKEVRAALAKGREGFRETALEAVADKLSPTQVADIVKAIGEQIQRMFSTAVKYSNENAGKGGEKPIFFQEAEGKPKMDSVGV